MTTTVSICALAVAMLALVKWLDVISQRWLVLESQSKQLAVQMSDMNLRLRILESQSKQQKESLP